MCFTPTVTSLSILKGLLFTTKILSLCPLRDSRCNNKFSFQQQLAG